MEDEVDPRILLAEAETILLVDWPSREVPDALARAGFAVIAQEGPSDSDYVTYVVVGDAVQRIALDEVPDRADIVYAHRPTDELDEIAALAARLHATTIWFQSGRDGAGGPDTRGCWLSDADAALARAVVESAGLRYVDHPYIADAVRDQH